MSSQDRVVLEYHPQDFYAMNQAVPNKGDCAATAESASTSTLTEYQKMLCTNKESVDGVLQQQRLNAGMSQKIYDIQSKYYGEVLKSFNLGIGIIGLISFLYYNRSA